MAARVAAKVAAKVTKAVHRDLLRGGLSSSHGSSCCILQGSVCRWSLVARLSLLP